MSNERRLEIRVDSVDRVVILERRGIGRRVKYHKGLTGQQAADLVARFVADESNRISNLNLRFVERGERERAKHAAIP